MHNGQSATFMVVWNLIDRNKRMGYFQKFVVFYLFCNITLQIENYSLRNIVGFIFRIGSCFTSVVLVIARIAYAAILELGIRKVKHLGSFRR